MYRVKCKTCLELFESIAPTKNQECPVCKDKIYQNALKVCKGLCLYCGKEIPVSRLQKGRVTCNNLSCCVKYTHSKRDEDSKKEINSKISNSVKNTFANKSPEEKEQYSRKMSIINKEIGSRPEVKEKHSKAMREYYSMEENRLKQSKILSEVWSSEKMREERSRQSKEYWSKEENRQKQSKIQKKRFEDPNQREKISASIRENLKNVECRVKKLYIEKLYCIDHLDPVTDRDIIEEFYSLSPEEIYYRHTKRLDLEYLKEKVFTNGEYDYRKARVHFTLSVSTEYALRAENGLEIQTSSSFEELSVLNYIKSLFPQYTYVSGDRSILTNPSTRKSLEIDILILKEDKIVCGVEYNGGHWHSREDQSREELKTRLCEEKGFRLFHVWYDNLENDLYAVLEFLSSLLDK